MRRGSAVAALRAGGAWECVETLPSEESNSGNPADAGRIPKTTGEKETPFAFADEGCTKGACMAVMVLQQSSPE